MTVLTDTEQLQRAVPDVPEHSAPAGAGVLDEVRSFLTRFAVLPSDAAADAVTLWAAHSWVSAAFSTSPRLALLSQGPASGKTRVLDLLSLLCRKATLETDPTGPGLTSMITTEHPTVLLDETDCIFGTAGSSGSHRALRAILNSGYKAGATVTRRQGGGYVKSDIFGPVAFAGLGILPATLMTRSIVVPMRPRRAGEKCESYLPRLHAPYGLAVGEALGGWCKSVALDLATSWPELPDGIEDRSAEVWEPLLAIADAAGGDWPARARAAAVELALGAADEPPCSPQQRLLDDLKTVWTEPGNLPTAVLIERLYGIDGGPWQALWPDPAAAPRELAALLRPLGVAPVKIRYGPKAVQGYRRADFPLGG